MNTTAAFASLTAVAVSAATLGSVMALYVALGLIGVNMFYVIALELFFIIRHDRRTGDRKDQLKMYRAWRGR